ncbi:hypothetical protein MCOR25_010139 [Pyricularia grisea]|nr:hypothetical protein MCOR25_010139 [Pyricularia grisea]
MASTKQLSGEDFPDSIDKLKADAATLSREATSGLEEQQKKLRQVALIQQQMSRPATVNAINIHGANNLRRGFLDRIVKPLVDDENNAATTLGDVLGRLETVTTKLARFDLFKKEPEIWLSSAGDSDPLAAVTDLNIDIKVTERGRLMLKTGTDLGDTEGSAYGNLLLRNVFGGAETLSLNASAGTRTRSAYSAVFATPINSNPDCRFSFEALTSATEKPWASHEEVTKSATARLQLVSATGDTHSFAAGEAWRQVTGLAGKASPSVRTDAGDSVKTSLQHIFTRDRRDNPLMPQNGYLLRTTSELAGWGPLGGDVSFSKSEMELVGAVPVTLPGLSNKHTGISFGAGFKMGMLYPLPLGYSLSSRALPSRINDRFLLGGPTDVRGFKIGGLGPRDGADAVGGDVYAAAGVNMLLPVPKTGPDSPLRLQLFANGGRMVGLKDKSENKSTSGMEPGAVFQGMKGALGDLITGLPSMSAGVGLVYAHPVARFELNFSLPLVMRMGEESRKGLQFGVGVNFL